MFRKLKKKFLTFTDWCLETLLPYSFAVGLLIASALGISGIIVWLIKWITSMIGVV